MDTAVSRAMRLVLLTTGAGGDPRAAWFEGVHAGDLVEAARHGGFHLVEVAETALRGLDPELAAGQLLGPGQPAPLPLVRRATFDALIGLPSTVASPRQLDDLDWPVQAAPTPRLRESLRTGKRTVKPGSVVLASDTLDDGWWEAEVISIGPGDELVLRWRDFPGHDEFRKSVGAVAMPPVGGVR